jgi:hypothetical protein
MALTSLLDEALDAWEYTRNGLIAEVAQGFSPADATSERGRS